MTDRHMRKQPYHFTHPLLRARDWQDRPELASLCDWWRQVGKGVCALVGIGGAGKTAIVDRFLRVLPGVLPPELGVCRQASLPKPRRLFVFSFYDAPNPDAYFAQLAAWLTERMNRLQTAQPSYEQTVGLLEYAGPRCRRTGCAAPRMGRSLMAGCAASCSAPPRAGWGRLPC
jgi:hypothetical protein